MRDAPYWRVTPSFWPSTAAWSEDARLFAIYLLTCQHRTTEGLFVLRLPYIWADLNWEPDRLTEPLAELVAEGFIEHDPERSVFLIVKALDYQAPANPKVCESALKKLALVPADSPLTCSFRRLCQRYSQRLHERLPEQFGQPLTQPLALALAQTQALTPSAARLSSRVTQTSERLYPQAAPTGDVA